MPAKVTTELFIERANLIHGEHYDYQLVDYTHSKTKIKIICEMHGEFLQTPSHHLKGSRLSSLW